MHLCTLKTKGNQYVMVLYETIGNNTLVEPMRNRTSGEMVRAYQVLIDRMEEKDIHPRLHILDNKCSTEFKDAIKEKMKYQLVPPDNHRRNVAKKQSKLSRITLWRCVAEPTAISYWSCGAKYRGKLSTSLTCCASRRQTQQCQHLSRCMGSTSTKRTLC